MARRTSKKRFGHHSREKHGHDQDVLPITIKVKKGNRVRRVKLFGFSRGAMSHVAQIITKRLERWFRGVPGKAIELICEFGKARAELGTIFRKTRLSVLNALRTLAPAH